MPLKAYFQRVSQFNFESINSSTVFYIRLWTANVIEFYTRTHAHTHLLCKYGILSKGELQRLVPVEE